MVSEGVFLEWADVFGNYYGTAPPILRRSWQRGRDAGARHRRSRVRGRSAAGGSNTPAASCCHRGGILEQRLRGRSKDSEEQIRQRLEMAGRKSTNSLRYQYVVVNDALDAAVERLRAMVLAERARVKSMRPPPKRLFETLQHGKRHPRLTIGSTSSPVHRATAGQLSRGALPRARQLRVAPCRARRREEQLNSIRIPAPTPQTRKRIGSCGVVVRSGKSASRVACSKWMCAMSSSRSA